MTKVVSYLAGIPPSTKNDGKKEILTRFAEGVAAVGDESILHTGNNIIPCDVAFIQGWTHELGKTAPHLTLRQQVIDEQRIKNKRLLIADSNIFGYKNKNHPSNYLRYSFDGVFPTTGNYFAENPNPARWEQISQDLSLSLKPWRTQGNHILICTQRNGGWSMKGLSVMEWLDQTVARLRRFTDRPIRVRAHPGDRSSKNYLIKPKKSEWELSKNVELLDDFDDAWAVVTYNSSPGVAAAIEGIPVFVTDPMVRTSQAFAVANTKLQNIETPEIHERQSWVERLAMSHWNFKELSNGSAWKHIRQFI
jgi:hypothetical protein